MLVCPLRSPRLRSRLGMPRERGRPSLCSSLLCRVWLCGLLPDGQLIRHLHGERLLGDRRLSLWLINPHLGWLAASTTATTSSRLEFDPHACLHTKTHAQWLTAAAEQEASCRNQCERRCSDCESLSVRICRNMEYIRLALRNEQELDRGAHRSGESDGSRASGWRQANHDLPTQRQRQQSHGAARAAPNDRERNFLIARAAAGGTGQQRLT